MLFSGSLAADRRVVLNMASVGFMDSSGLGAILEHIRRSGPVGGSVRITHASRPVHQVVKITGLSELLDDETNASASPARTSRR